jgi:hypothetical protein
MDVRQVMGGDVAPIRTIRTDYCCRRSVNQRRTADPDG